MTPVVRFAPSPTGLLHIGNARTALINWLFARSQGGKFIFRLDDTDLERSRNAYTQGLHRDLEWLGLAHDAFYAQSQRLDLYDQAVVRLKESGRLYACYETAEELNLKRKLQRTQGLPPLYDRTGLALTDTQKQAFEIEGRRPHWRFLLKDEAVSWTDLSRGPLRFEPHTMSDPVLIREDGSPVYTLSSVVDDIDLGITHILRGEDHISNTAVQIQLFTALGGDVSALTFGHFPLLVGEQGEALSKRLGSLTVQSLRDQGIENLCLASYLVQLGTSESITPATSLKQLIEEFDIDHFGRASPRFSPTLLERLNGKFLHQCAFTEIQPRLEALGLKDITEQLWHLFRGNLETLSDIKSLQESLYGEIEPVIEDPAYIELALKALPSEPLDTTTWGTWTTLLKEQTDRRGKALFMPLRLALTGQNHGPEMKDYLPVLGREKALKRLQGLRA